MTMRHRDANNALDVQSQNVKSENVQSGSVQGVVRKNTKTTYTQRLAASLNEALAAQQVLAKVGMRQQDNLLYVALEPLPTEDVSGSSGPDARSLLPIVQQALTELKLNWLKLAKVSGRLAGQSSPLWQAELLFGKVPPIAETLMGRDPVVVPVEAVSREAGSTKAGSIGDVNVHIGGNMSGQMIIGHNNNQAYFNYTYNVAHGGVLNVAPQATVKSRPTPLMLRPRRFENLLDRRAVLPMLRESLWQGLPVEVYAAAGFGKTSLMRHVAHDEQLVSAFPDGVVYLSAHWQQAEDVLQSLYDAFYESSPPLKPSYGQVQQSLAKKQSLVILNHLSLEKEEMDWLMAALPACTFVLVSVARFYWQEGAAIALKGLPLPEAIALIQIELGRALTQDEQYAAKSLWAALSGNPLQLRRAAAQAKADDESLMVLAQSMQAVPGQTISARSLFQKIASRLSTAQQSALALMGAMGGVALSAEQSIAIAQMPNMAETLTELADLHLVDATTTMNTTTPYPHTTYQLSADLTKLVPQNASSQAWLAKATEYFIAEGVEAVMPASSVPTNTNALLHLLEWTQHTGQWKDSLALARYLDQALALSGQWAQWQQVLTDSVQAAEQLGDNASKAWALHQLGTRSLALGFATRADSWLSRALRLREDLGDMAGAAVTRHNLALIAVPLADGKHATPLDPKASSSRGARGGALGRGLSWGLALVGTALLAGIGGILYGLNRGGMLPAAGAVTLSDTEIDFGVRALNSASEPKAVAFTNSGPEPIKIQQLVLAGEGDFVLATASSSGAQNCVVSVVLAPGNTCEVNTIFTPITAGEHTGEIVMVTGASSAAGSEVVETTVEPVALVGMVTPETVTVPPVTAPAVTAPAVSDSSASDSSAPDEPRLPPSKEPNLLADDDPTEPDSSSTDSSSTDPTEPDSPSTDSSPPAVVPGVPPGVSPGRPTQANRDPVAIDYNFTINQGEPLTINLLADVFDPDKGDVLSLSGVANLDVGGQLENNGDGSVTYLPWQGAVDYSGQYTNSFEYTVTDGRGGEGRGVISITVLVSPVEELPAEELPAEESPPNEPSPNQPPPDDAPPNELPELPPSESPDIR